MASELSQNQSNGVPLPEIGTKLSVPYPPDDAQLAVTTFSAQGWEDYARDGLDSMVRYFPGPIVAYFEEDQPEQPWGERVEWRPLLQCLGLSDILDWAWANPVLQGVIPKGYSYQFDLAKFCRKVFVQADAAARFHGWLWWLDADTRLLKPIPPGLAPSLLKDDCTAAMGRIGFHIESGVVLWNTAHPDSERFFKRYQELFLTGEILGLPGWHDCWAYQKALRDTGARNKNLTPGLRGMQPVIDQSPFKGLLDHNKGMRKYGSDAKRRDKAGKKLDRPIPRASSGVEGTGDDSPGKGPADVRPPG